MKDVEEYTSFVWFSDTFILYSHDNSLKCFSAIARLAHVFSASLIKAHIPFRGAIAYGRLYADYDNGVFFGKGLIEAYEYGEAQDWIGIVLCPSAEDILNKENHDYVGNYRFSHTNIPYKIRLKQSLPACIFGAWTQRGTRQCLNALKEMIKGDSSPEIAKKYHHTIAFLEKHLKE